MKPIFVFCILFLICFPAQAQKYENSSLDSMMKILNSGYPDTNRIKLLKTIAYTYYNIDPDKGLQYAKKCYFLADSIKWKKGVAIAENVIGLNFWALAQEDSALKYNKLALHYFDSVKDQGTAASVLTNIGMVYDDKGDNKSALEAYMKALKYFEMTGNNLGIAKTYSNIGVMYSGISDHVNAMDYLFKALKLAETVNDKNLIATTLSNIADDYKYQTKFGLAIKYAQQSIQVFKSINSKIGIAMNYRNMGDIYRMDKKNADAISYFQQAITLFKEINDARKMALAQTDIGNLYLDQGKYVEALEALFAALPLNEANGSKNSTIINTGNIGETYLAIYNDSTNKTYPDSLTGANRKKILLHAMEYLKKSAESSREINFNDGIIQYYKDLAVVNKLYGNYPKAFEYLSASNQVRDSIYSDQNINRISNLEAAREKELKDKIDKLNLEAKLHERIILFIGFSTLLVIIIFIFRSYRVQQKSNQLLASEKKRSDDLLLNILPVEVADELKETGKAAARNFTNVTVMFTDFKGFTKKAELLTAEELVNELDVCFREFDKIISRYGIEKIKTIGDAYMAVSGLPVADAHHAEKMVLAAIELRDFMLERTKLLGEKTFEMRIGIHSGSVVAGIVGLNKFAYDVWGDTVNTAARMEENCTAGEINISETTYQLVKDKFEFVYRGEIKAKNKGELKMFYITKSLLVNAPKLVREFA